MNKNVIIITTKNDEVIAGKYVNENEKYIKIIMKVVTIYK